MAALHSGKSLGVAFLWHMHQPYYKDPLGGKYEMPWVRLHGVKDYYPMAALVEDFEDIRVTFNLVPSLVEQINDYALNNATDTFLDLTLKRAKDLTFEDRVGILNHFFKVNFKQFIEPSARYSALLLKKGMKPLTGTALKRVVKSFTNQDFLDLQVLFELAWFHSITVDEDAHLRDLIIKGSQFAEDDKEYIVNKQREVVARILPLYRKLQDEGRIEITTTPYYHPILPLICDTSEARPSLPHSPLPKKFSHPEDAEWQVESAIRYHTEQFGSPPRGMWPGEGSVSDEALGIIAKKGISWVATDEDILFQSLSLYDRKYKGVTQFDRKIIYQPYRYRGASGECTMIFRDKNLSDIISFNYNEWDQAEAAHDLIGHCRRVAENLKDTDRGLMAVIMDGENAWEYYEDNGRKFFETLYRNLDKQTDICSTTISDYLAVESPKRTLSKIFPGSWINHNFDIWIGQEQDNVSWEYLGRVRKDLVRFTAQERKAEGSDGGNRVRDAWRELYIAEGSDWNWWYGGKAHAGNHNPFDPLYRTHLKNIYRIMKKPIPDFLKISIA